MKVVRNHRDSGSVFPCRWIIPVGIYNEIGRCVFDKENTRMFFDVIDRRYNKEGPNTMIFTSNKGPDKWGEFFNEDSSLLCALDRIFDDATVFMIKGNSYRDG